MDKKIILDNYERRLGSKGKTRQLYMKFAGDFLKHCDGSFDRQTIDKYLDYLRKKRKYSDGSVNFAFRVIRTMFKRSEAEFRLEGIEWPYNRGESPQIREDEIDAPALDPGIIEEMITVTKEKGEPDMKAFLAISTIYGTRRVEMRGLTDEDVHVRDRTIHITTAKHGRERTHLIPEEIVPALDGYDFKQTISEFSLFTLWYRLEALIGLQHTNQVGFHSIRRSLNTLLLELLPEPTVMSFLRWKQRTSSHMPYRYSAQRFVGREGTTTRVVGNARDVDQKVFEVHPFLEIWR